MPDDVFEIRGKGGDPSDGGLIACLYRENHPHGGDEANAKAIAAVPDMASALKQIREAVSKRQLPITDQVYQIADAALKKAGLSDG